MKTIKLLSAIAILGMVLISCKKESTSTSLLGVKVKATNSTFSVLKSVSATTPAFVWDTCFLNVSEIEFKAKKHESEQSGDSTTVRYKWQGSKKVDLLSINSLIGEISLQPGVFEEVELEVQAQKISAGTTPVFYLAGSYTDANNVKVSVVVVVNEDFKFKVEKEGAVLKGVNDYSALVNINLAQLMNGISQSDLSSAILSGGRIVISSASNTSLYSKISANISLCEDVEYHQED
jgi:hypothetical protein